MTRPSEHKQRLLARNAALRVELSRELAGLRGELAPALHRGEQALAALAWARAHAPLLAGLAALAGTLLLRRRGAAPGAARAPLLQRLARLLRLTLAVGGLVLRFTRPASPRAAPAPQRPAA